MPIFPKTVTVIMAAVALLSFYTVQAGNPPTDPAVYEYLNQVRAGSGLPPLARDPELDKNSFRIAFATCLIKKTRREPNSAGFVRAVGFYAPFVSEPEEMKTAVKRWQALGGEEYNLLVSPTKTKVGCALYPCHLTPTGTLGAEGGDYSYHSVCQYA